MILASVIVTAYGLTGLAEEIKSGLQPGEAPPAFYVHDITGPSAGESLCYRCQYGNRPVISIFARAVDDNLAQLIKEVDTKVGQHADQQLKAFVVLLTDDQENAKTSLAQLAQQKEIKNVPLTVFEGQQGPEDYKISSAADVSVMMWVESDVKVSRALPKGELDKDAVKRILADSSKILN
jgi:hypothetical protein